MKPDRRDRQPRPGPRSGPGPRPNPAQAKPRPAPRPTPPKADPTHWHDVAQWYDALVGQQGSEYHQHVIIPGVLRMLQRREGSPLRIADLACGQGVLARRLAQEGHTVVGVDAAPALVDAARARSAGESLPLTYLVADATRMNPLPPELPPGTFDAVTIILAIQNMTPLSPVWQACRAMLKEGGSLLVVMMHPCFRVPRHTDWHWNDADARQERTVWQYLSSVKIPIQTHPGLAAHGKSEDATTHFHRPLQAYINTLGSAGLLLDHIEEWVSHKTSQPGPKAAALDRARKEIPMFLALRARAVGR